MAVLRVEIAIVPIKRNDRTHCDDVVYNMSHGIQQVIDGAVLLTRAGQSPGQIGFLTFAEGSRDPD